MNKIKLFLPLGRFFTPGEVFVGAGSLGVIATLNAARVAVIISPSASKDERIRATLDKALRRTVSVVVDAPSGEPVLSRLQPAMERVAEFRPDWIVAVGGGAVMDAAKLIWAFYEHPGLSQAQWSRPQALPALRGKARFAAVPTLPGSGSEASSTATFQLDADGRKAFLVSHELQPDIAILDPQLARGVPPATFATSALDALAHAVEGYGSRFANPLTDMAAEGATRRILEGLDHAVASPDDMPARAEIMTAAFLGGTVQNFAIPGLGHAIAHQLAFKGVPHALSTGALLAPGIEINGRSNAETRARYDRLGRAAGVADAEGLRAAIAALADTHGLTRGFRERTAGVDWTDAAFLEGVLADPCARANPAPAGPELVAEFQQAAFA